MKPQNFVPDGHVGMRIDTSSFTLTSSVLGKRCRLSTGSGLFDAVSNLMAAQLCGGVFVRTQWFSRLLIISFRDLLDFHGIIDHKVHELVKPLYPRSAKSAMRDGNENRPLSFLRCVWQAVHITRC